MQKNWKKTENSGTWVLIWECTARAIQWIPIWQGLVGFQKSVHACVLDDNSLSIERVKFLDGINFIPFRQEKNLHILSSKLNFLWIFRLVVMDFLRIMFWPIIAKYSQIIKDILEIVEEEMVRVYQPPKFSVKFCLWIYEPNCEFMLWLPVLCNTYFYHIIWGLKCIS